MLNGDNREFPKDGLAPILRQYRVPYPDEEEIGRTVESLRMYVPSKKRRRHAEKLKRLLYDTAVCMNFTHVSFWVISVLIYAAGCALSLGTPLDAYKMVFLLAPLPFVFSLLEAFRGREEGVVELELVCRITPQEILVSKILVVGLYNVFLNLSLSLILFFEKPSVALWKITLSWLLPMLLTGSAALWLCSKIKSVYAVPITLSCWLAVTAAVTVQERVFSLFLNMNGWCFAALLLVGVALWAKGIFTLKDRYYFVREAAIWN